MVQFLLILAFNVVLTVLAVCWLIRVFSKNKRDRLERPHYEEPDFSQFEGNPDDEYVPLIAKPDDDSSSNPFADAYVPFADRAEEHRFADGNYAPLDEDAEVEITSIVEPKPIFGTRVSVRQSCLRAARHMESCAQATYSRHDFVEAEAFARAALEEVEQNMKRDHWYAPFVLNWLAYLRYEQGFSIEARDLWEQAEQVALEWFEQCQQLLPDIRQNLRMFRENFYN